MDKSKVSKKSDLTASPPEDQAPNKVPRSERFLRIIKELENIRGKIMMTIHLFEEKEEEDIVKILFYINRKIYKLMDRLEKKDGKS